MRKNLKKLIAMGLTAVMAVSAMSISALADDDNEAVYTYIQDGQEINITQADLDAEHWDKDALGDTAPVIYENFPMSMTGFANDFAELSLDIVYMKKLDEMVSVNLKITDLINDTVIYNNALVQQSFYSPTLEINGQYEVTLTETADGKTNEYKRVVFTNKTEAEMPEFVSNPTVNENAQILIADTDTLRAGQTINENGQIVVDSRVAKYDKILAKDFLEYCNTLSEDKVYRIFANEGAKQYGGFFSKANGNEIYDLTIDAYDWRDIYEPATVSYPSNITIEQIKSKAKEIRLQDSSFTLKESSSSGKYAAYCIYLPDSYAATGNKTKGIFNITWTGTSKTTIQLWYDDGVKTTSAGTYTTVDNTNSRTISIDVDDYRNSSTKYMAFYALIYFPSAVDGYGMINVEPVENSGYTDDGKDDDVTGSLYKAYTENSVTELANTEFTLTDSWDIDAFGIGYYGSNRKTYKIEIKNRSLNEQIQLESGEFPRGSSEKYLTLWSLKEIENVVIMTSSRTFTIPKNTDMIIYCDPVSTGEKIISIQNTATGSQKSNKYQLSYKKM